MSRSEKWGDINYGLGGPLTVSKFLENHVRTNNVSENHASGNHISFLNFPILGHPCHSCGYESSRLKRIKSLSDIV